MQKDFTSLVEANFKQWYLNEQRKKKSAKKQTLYCNVYPNDKDIYGRKKVMKNE